MKKTLILLLVASLLLLVIGLTGCGKTETASSGGSDESVADLLAKGKNNPGMAFDYVVTAKAAQMSGKMWISGKNMKSEITVQGQRMISIVDGVDNVAYMYNPEQNSAMKMPLNNIKSNKSVDAPDKEIQGMDPAQITALETVTYDGAECRVLSLKRPVDQSEVKLWVREDCGIPVRTEVTEPSGDKTVVEYKNLVIGALPAETFTLPAGVQVTDMSQIMKQMGNSQPPNN